MESILPNNLIQYFGTNTYNALKFIRNLAKNLNNSRNISNNQDKKETIEGYAIDIYSLTGIKYNPKELYFHNDKKYYIRYFINIYNKHSNQLYGNTYRSPLFPIKINKNNNIELSDKKPFRFYVLLQQPKYERLIVQIILVETNDDNDENSDKVILKEKCQGWASLTFPEDNENQNEEKGKKISEINRGTPRDLILSSYHLKYPNANMTYLPIKYPDLKSINFLLPTNIILAYNESLPGLRQRKLPEFSRYIEALNTVNFKTAYVKNIVIEINPQLEENIIEFGKEYREKKYKVDENEYNNKIYIKERRIKCGMHNTWKFINSNGIQNSITLTKISKRKLQSSGLLMIDNFFSDPLSCAAIILELEYTLTIQINESQKEDNLNLTLGYHIYVPEKINEGNYSKDKLLMFTGPGSTIYGEKMWYSKNIEDRNIKISYVLSQNPNLNYINQVEMDEVEKMNKAKQNALVDLNNQMLLRGVQNKEKDDNDINKTYYEKKLEKQKQELEEKNEENEKLKIKLKQKELAHNNVMGKYNIKEKKKELDKKKDKKEINNIPAESEENKIPMEESKEYKEFILFKEKKEIYVKELEEKMEMLKEIQKPKVSDYEIPIKNITERDKSYLIKEGVMDLDIKEQVDSYINYNLEEELCRHGLATNFNFQFLSFKPSRVYYSDLRNVPEKIQFFFDFFNESKLHTSVCNITRPEEANNKNYYFFNNPLILKKENIDMSSALLNDTKSEISIEVKYDPSLDTSIDFRDFVKYLTNRRLVVQIKDVQKCLNVGYIKIPLKDLIGQKKDKIQLKKEYKVYDDNFNIRGYIELLISASKYQTLRAYTYNRNNFTNINSKEGYNTLSKKKKIKVEQMDINKLKTQNKNLYNLTMNSLKNQNNNQDNTILENEMNKSRQRKLRIEPELEKRIRVMRYFSNKNNLETDNKNNTNYQFGTKIQLEEKKLNELKQKQANDEQFIDTLKACEQYRDFNRAEILSKVSQDNHKNVYNISLILGQPIYFNYSVFNDSSIEELCHISIEKISNKKDNKRTNKIVQVLSTPLEWRAIVEKEKLKRPNNYEVISDQLDMIIKPGETIPLVIKLLSFIENREEENYSVSINKKNGQPLFFLLIKIKQVFPIYDHVFHYNCPLDNTTQKIIMKNPFSPTKTERMLNNVVISDNSIALALDEDTHNFNFSITQDDYQNDFVIFFYSDKERTNLYLTWKVEIDWIETFEMTGIRGSKMSSKLFIVNNQQLNKEASYSGSKLTLQLFTDLPDVIIFPEDSKLSFVLEPNTELTKSIILYPRKEMGNMAIINCVNIYTRNLYKRWLIKYRTELPEINDTEIVECIIGGQNILDYSYKNRTKKFMVLSFYSGNEEVLEVIDKVQTFNGGETKNIKLKVNDKGAPGKEEVLLFISDDSDDFCKTILFKIYFKE